MAISHFDMVPTMVSNSCVDTDTAITPSPAFNVDDMKQQQ